MRYSPEALLAFVEAASLGSFSAAARKLKKSQSTVSIAIAHFEAIDRLAIQRGAEPDVIDAFARCRLGDQIVVPLHRIGREIGEPGQVAVGAVTDGQRAAILARVIAAVGAAPEIAVLAHRRAVAGPAVDGAAPDHVRDDQRQRRQAGDDGALRLKIT